MNGDLVVLAADSLVRLVNADSGAALGNVQVNDGEITDIALSDNQIILSIEATAVSPQRYFTVALGIEALGR